MARASAPKPSERWGQPVIVENRHWGGRSSRSRRSRGGAGFDGYMLVTHTQQVALLPLFVKDVDIEPGRNLQPLSTAFYAPYVIITNTQVPAKSLREFIDYAKANPES